MPNETSQIAKATAVAIVQNGGISINLAGEEPTTGYAASAALHPALITPGYCDAQTVENFIEERRELLETPGHYLGAWFDAGKTYLEVARVFENRDEALAYASDLNELAIYDVAVQETVFVAPLEAVA